MDAGAAARAGLHSTLGHAIASEMRVGDVLGRNIAMQIVDIFHGSDGDGLLGNDFFRGHIVHIDYNTGDLDLFARDGFTPPADALPLTIDFREGMPLVSVEVDSAFRDRYRHRHRLGRYFAWPNVFQRSGRRNVLSKLRPRNRNEFSRGTAERSAGKSSRARFGGVRFTSAPADLIRPLPNDLDIPLNGILGCNILATLNGGSTTTPTAHGFATPKTRPAILADCSGARALRLTRHRAHWRQSRSRAAGPVQRCSSCRQSCREGWRCLRLSSLAK